MPNKYVRMKRRKNDRSRRVMVPQWIDPFPWAQGSIPEKMVMAELARRGIFFQHSTTSNTVGGGVDPTWKADILCPQYKIWLEIQGAYFHTLPGAVERDALRFVTVEAAGWKPLFWWEDDIRTRLIEIVNEVPEFYQVSKEVQVGWGANTAAGFYEGDAPDTLKGLRKALANRRKPPQNLLVRRRSKRRKQYSI
jgi:G:T-mismatch repair DNA endonuclease (very short patch repair protein)